MARSGSRRILRRVARRQAAALSLAGLLLLLVTATALAVTGDLTQPAPPAGCVSETGSGPCADGHGVSNAARRDGEPGRQERLRRFVTSISATATGRLGALQSRSRPLGRSASPRAPPGCVSETGAGPCADGHALGRPWSVAVSPDGKSVYVASGRKRRVARFDRNTTTGAISQPAGAAGCISETERGPVPTAMRSAGPASVTVSPDGKSVYVSSFTGPVDAVARLNRNTTTGAISQPAWDGRLRQRDRGGALRRRARTRVSRPRLAVSPDGKSVYVASRTATPWRVSTATRPPGRSASPPAPPAA